MKLEEQVVSLELAQKLKELGVEQKSVCYWREFQLTAEFENKIIWDVDTELSYRSTISNVLQSVAAFTVAELGEMLPEEIEQNEISSLFTANRGLKQSWVIKYQQAHSHVVKFYQEASTEADARAKMLIYLLEKGLINN